MMRKLIIILVSLGFVFLSLTLAQATAIDLNDFCPGGNVTIASDGSWAKMTEDPNYSSAVLSDDPYYGSSYPGIYIPDNAMTLTFNYSFVEPSGNVDEFYAFLYDLSSYPTPLTDQNGNPLKFRADATSSGTVTWNLFGASFLGTTVGMEFQLNWLSGDPYPSSDLTNNSSVIVSNLNVNPVPEPSTILLVGLGLAGVFTMTKRNGKKTARSDEVWQ